MRFVDNVRLNSCVKSEAQLSGNGSCDGRCGTGFLRGTPLLSAIVGPCTRARVRSSMEGGVTQVEGEECGCRSWRQFE